MNNIWKPVVEYEGLYEVSNTGLVRSVYKVVRSSNGKTFHYKPRHLKKYLDHNGYEYISLSKCGVKKKYKVHQLVCKAFLPNPSCYKQVNHKDECKTNNCVDNLEWCDQIYNSNYGTRNQRISSAKINAKYNSKPIVQYDLSGNLIKEFPSTREAQRLTGLCRVGIGRCCRGTLKSYSGFIWKFKSV